jgi:hypothetical protein
VNVEEKHALWVKQCRHLDELNEAGGGEDMDHFRDCNDEHDTLSHVLAWSMGPVLAENERLNGLLAAAHRDAEVGGRVIEGRHKTEVERLRAKLEGVLNALRGEK